MTFLYTFNKKTAMVPLARKFILILCCMVYIQFSSAQPGEEDTPLIKAIESRNIQKVKQLIENGADVNEEGGFFKTPMSSAIQTNQIEMVELLIEKGATSRSGLTDAVRQGNIKMAAFLLDNGFYIGTAVVNAAEINNLEMVKLLVDHGANVNDSQKRRDGLFRRKYYVTAIEMAVKNNNKDMCLYLVDNGVSLPTAIDECFAQQKTDIVKTLIDQSADLDGNMHKAFRAGNMEAIKYCINKGAEKNSKDEEGKTIFILAAESGDLKITRFCINELDMDPKALSYKHETALMLAARTGNTSLLNYLIGLGIEMEAENSDGETALFYALEADDNAAFSFLVNNNADISHITNDKSTLLIKAAKEEQTEAMRLLLNAGIDVNAKNAMGQTAFEYVFGAFTPDDNLINLFLEKGADIETKDSRGRTLLFLAIEEGDLEKVKTLKTRGANINVYDNQNNRPKVSSSQMVGYLVENGADINAVDHRHDTYLCDALTLNDLKLAHFLIQKGIDINQNCYFEEPPLIKAIEEENIPFIKLLVNNNADVNAIGYFNKSVMDYALEVGNEEIIDYLKSHGSMTKEDANEAYMKSLEVEKKLEEAIKQKQVDEVEKRLKENDNLTLKDDLIKQIAYMGAAEGRLYILDYAIKRLGFSVNDAINLDKQTLLMIAAINQKINAINYLLNNGADKNQKDYNNKTALDYTKNQEIRNILKD